MFPPGAARRAFQRAALLKFHLTASRAYLRVLRDSRQVTRVMSSTRYRTPLIPSRVSFSLPTDVLTWAAPRRFCGRQAAR